MTQVVPVCADGQREAGAAAVLVLALAAVLALVAMTSAWLGAVAVARQRAASAADLAALAAAQQALAAEGTPCARARTVAAAGGAELASCTLDGDVVEVVVHLRPRGPVGALGAATARARAGPATSGLWEG